MSLTPQQIKFIEFIDNFTKEHGYAPTQWEIAKNFGFKSLGTVQDYISRLKQKGYLKKSWNGKRSLALKTKRQSLPLLGRVAAGAPIEAVLHEESVEVPASMLTKQSERFALEVRGDSMLEDGICDGDYVIIQRQKVAENGDTVVALLDNEATIKRFYRHGEQIELHPANPRFPIIYVDPKEPFEIAGILVGVIRHAH